MRAAFGTPGFKRLYLGLTASMLGDSLMLIVLSMWVKQLTGSNGAAGLTFLWLTIPALMAPLFGYVVDRVPRRAFLVGVNLGSALAMMPLLLVRDASDVWIIYTVAFLYGVSFVVMPAALNGLLKDMLREEVLVEANASLSVTREALRLVGRAAADHRRVQHPAPAADPRPADGQGLHGDRGPRDDTAGALHRRRRSAGLGPRLPVDLRAHGRRHARGSRLPGHHAPGPDAPSAPGRGERGRRGRDGWGMMAR